MKNSNNSSGVLTPESKNQFKGVLCKHATLPLDSNKASKISIAEFQKDGLKIGSWSSFLALQNFIYDSYAPLFFPKSKISSSAPGKPCILFFGAVGSLLKHCVSSGRGTCFSCDTCSGAVRILWTRMINIFIFICYLWKSVERLLTTSCELMVHGLCMACRFVILSELWWIIH